MSIIMYYVYDQLSIPKHGEADHYTVDEVNLCIRLKGFNTAEEANEFISENSDQCWWPVNNGQSYSWVPTDCPSKECAVEYIVNGLNMSVYDYE